MHHNNCILTRIATYYDNNNQVNNIISQEDSDQAYENYVQSQYSLQSFQSSNWSQVAYNLKYEETRIGLYGDTFKSNKNNIITIEWHVRKLTDRSITDADVAIQDLYNDHVIDEVEAAQL